MSDGTTAVTETDYAVRVSDRDGPVMQVSRRGIWVPPDIPTDECARRVLDALSPMIRDIIQAEIERLTSERDEARAEVERLIAERDEAQSESVRLKTERDEQKRQNYQVVYGCDALVDSARRRAEKATAERDEARAEVERLRANGQGMFDSSRPSDEDIWREAFMTLLPSYPWEKAAAHADRALAEYRKRWPR